MDLDWEISEPGRDLIEGWRCGSVVVWFENGEICCCVDNTMLLNVSLGVRVRRAAQVVHGDGQSDLEKHCLKRCCYATCFSRESGESAGT